MQDMPACVTFKSQSTVAQRDWLRRTRIPLASMVFAPSRAMRLYTYDTLARLPLIHPDCLTASESTLRLVAGLEAESATAEQFATFCRRFAALQSFKLDLPSEGPADVALKSLPRGLRHLSTNANLSSFQVPSMLLLLIPASYDWIL